MKLAIATFSLAALTLGWSVHHDRTLERPLAPPPRLPNSRILEVVRHCAEDKGRLVASRQRLKQRDYQAAIRGIDASRCPKQFQEVWLSYVEATTAHYRYNASLDEALVDGVGLLKGHPSSKRADANARLDTLQPWFEVKKSAVMFNCKIPGFIGDF